MKHSVDAVLANVLGLNEEPAGTLGGEKTDSARHPIESLFHEAEYGIVPASTVPAPIRKKVLSIEEVEEILAKRRRERLVKMGLDLIASARPRIREAIIKDSIEDFPQHSEALKLLLR
jgi:hypothetical protein